MPISSGQPRRLPSGVWNFLDVFVVHFVGYFVEWLEPQIAAQAPNRLLRQVDDCATSMVLNIAEGNGRYSYLDQRRFLHTAHSALVKTAAYLDLCLVKGLNPQGADITGKRVLDRIAAMLTRMEQAATK